ncbi:hypothetical protein [Pararhizobium sp. PWRC1-1]|uniref:hypothetical protein n=1 Tax=Pararhizobium sp. PWRC1-1 TaxID=2804566 RepID=UPI003CF4A5D7
MNRVLKSLLFAAALLPPSTTYADDYGLPGEWQQVTSNAGQCSSCKITIMRHGSVLTIAANNGWSAVVQTDAPGNALWAVGNGRWQKGKGGPYSGTLFDIAVVLKGEQLQMVMLTEIDNRRAGTIKAVFTRQSAEEPLIKM